MFHWLTEEAGISHLMHMTHCRNLCSSAVTDKSRTHTITSSCVCEG